MPDQDPEVVDSDDPADDTPDTGKSSRPWFLTPWPAIGLAAIGLVLAGLGISGFMTAGSEAEKESSALEQLAALEAEEADLLSDIETAQAEIDSAEADIAAARGAIESTDADISTAEANIEATEAPVRELQEEVWDVYASLQRIAELDERIISALEEAVASGNRRDLENMQDRVETVERTLLSDMENALGAFDQAVANAETMLVGTDSSLEISEDFESDVQGWEAGFATNGVAGPSAGGYLVNANDDGFLMWGVSPYDLADVTVEITAEPIDGANLGTFSYGVLCRAEETDYLGGYWFAVTGEGAFQVAWFGPGGEFNDLLDQAREDRPADASGLSAAVNRGLNANTLSVTCAGSELSFSVNDVVVWVGSDDNLTEGRIAVGAFSYGGEPITIRFDDLRLTGAAGEGGAS